MAVTCQKCGTGLPGQLVAVPHKTIENMTHEKEKVDPSDAKSQTIGELLRAENDDRRALYKLLSKELKIGADEVGKQNGIRNLKKAEPNHWFQLKSSVWAQRKDIKEEGG